ncbi:hypothetical protein B0H34DRAFT_737740 [Crassisporium funariophilum]|nr:hypothetical protein B0H34DRAFT_737740 [Crassisporium funariophilum]
MKLSSISVLLFALTSVSSTVTRSIPEPMSERRGSDKQMVSVGSEHVSVDKRQAEAVPFVIAGIAIGTMVLGWALSQLKSTTVTVNPAPSDPQTALEIMSKAVADLRSQSSAAGTRFSGVAVRFGVPQIPVWDGIIGQDWGTSIMTVNAAEGQSLWNFYWVTTGTITVNTPNVSNDMVIGGAYMSAQDPNGQNLWRFTIVLSPQ